MQLRTSLMAQWSRIHLSMQGTWVRSLVWGDPTCRRATKPVHHNYWACALEPMSHNYWSLCTLEPVGCNYWVHTPQLLKAAHSRAHVPQLLSLHAATTEACVPRACALQQEMPLQWDAHTLQLLKPACLEPVVCNKRCHCNEKPAHCNEEQPPLTTTRESPRAATKTQCSQKNK